MTKDEALDLALEALEEYSEQEDLTRAADQAITAIKQALEQPVQEPVAWMTIDSNGEEDDIWYENPEGKLLEGWTYKPLYAHPAPMKKPVAWLYPEGLEALQSGKCWTVYGTKQDDNCNIPVYLNAAVAPKVEPAKAECGGFDSRPAAPVQDVSLIDEGKTAAQPAVPDAITDRSEHPEYIQGWNDCRALMLGKGK